MELGQRLQSYRELKKVTQAEMAEYCGLSKNYISSIERGINKCNANTFIAYGEKLDVSLDELAGNKSYDRVIPNLKKVLSLMNENEQMKILQIIQIMKSN